MSGLMFAGMALGGIHIANAQNNVNPEIDNSRYTVMIPSEVNIDKNTGKGSFAVTGKVKAQSTIDVSIQSKNGYKLKDKNGELPYNIDKKSFSIDNSRSASDIPLNEEFNIASKTNTKVSGYYTDSLTFDITSESYKYRLDVNGNLDDNGIGDGRLDDFGRFDVYLNGKLVKENVEDFCEPIPYGTTWEIKNIRSLDGYRYKDSSDIRTKGVAGDVVEWEGDLLGDTSIYRITYVNLKFYSNKLTVNYYPNGAQKYNSSAENYTSSNDDFDINSSDIYKTQTYLYGADIPKNGLDDADRFKRTGYTCNNTYLAGSPASTVKVDAGSNVYAKSQDLAEAANVLSDFKKNNVTINLYPDWTPNTYTLTYNLNGGSFNDSTTQLFKFDSGDAISLEIPTKVGYSFTGWKINEVTMQPGDKIPKGWENFTLTAQWEKMTYSTGTVLKIEGTQYIVIKQEADNKYLVISGENIGNIQYQPNQDNNGNYYNIGQYDANDEKDKRFDGEDSNTYEGSYIDKFLENTWYTSLSSKMQNAIVTTQINQSTYKEIGHGANCELLSETDTAATDGNDWYYNEGTADNPKWVVYYKHKWTEADEGIFPSKVWHKQGTGYSGQTYNTITRHVYLPSIEDISDLVNLNDANKTYAFTQGTKGNTTHVWLRDNSAYSPRWGLGISKTYRSLCRHYVSSAWFGVRPAFVIDLSKVDATVVDTVKYK